MNQYSILKTVTAAVLLSISFAAGAQNDTASEPKKRNISVKPVTLAYTLTNGQAASRKINITNNMDKKLQFNVYMNDWMRDSIGGHIYTAPGQIARTCANWISFDKTFVELEPGESADINVKMAIPDSAFSAKDMKWAMLFVETIEEKVSPKNEKGMSSVINNKMRVGVHVLQTPPTASAKEVRLLSFNSVPDKENEYRLVCENTGEIQTECKTYLELSSLADGQKTTVDARVFPTFPGQKRNVAFTLPDTLAKGKYNVVAAVDAGDDVPLEAAQTVIEVK